MDQHHSIIGDIRICTFNCRGVKSSMPEIWQLCEMYDIVCLQEHWLLPCEVGTLSQVHANYLSWATSAVDISSNLLVGRPYGGTAILYKRSLASAITVVDTSEPRMTAISVKMSGGSVLIVNVYMPTDYKTYDCYEEYLDLCTKITALFDESEATHLFVTGDF